MAEAVNMTGCLGAICFKMVAALYAVMNLRSVFCLSSIVTALFGVTTGGS